MALLEVFAKIQKQSTTFCCRPSSLLHPKKLGTEVRLMYSCTEDRLSVKQTPSDTKKLAHNVCSIVAVHRAFFKEECDKIEMSILILAREYLPNYQQKGWGN